MLRTLYLKNYTLADELTVTFDRGLSIITGETGAGKSVIIGALSLLVGGRASPDLIRTGETKAIIEAEFDISSNKDIHRWLKTNDFDDNGMSLIIRREISSQSAARAFLNDSPTTLGLLKELGSMLIDLHGQHEHQSLLHPEKHRSYLDGYSHIDSDVEKYGVLYDSYTTIQHEIETLQKNKDIAAKERDFLEYQRNEIAAVSPKAGEDEEIERELNVLENGEELLEITSELHTSFYEDEKSIYAQLADAKAKLEHLATIDTTFAESVTELSQALSTVKELSSTFSHYGEKMEFNPQRLGELRTRGLALTRLKKKYGPRLADVIVKFEEIEAKIGPEGNIDEIIAAKEKELTTLRKEISLVASKMSEARQKAAKKFEKEIITILKELGMDDTKFEVRFSLQIDPNENLPFVEIEKKKYQLYRWGIDKIEFYISTNKGEEPKPLVRIASGGEVSRVMLALKSVLSKSDNIPVLVFDEIDTGISGRIAQKVGKAMKQLGAEHQVIAITHLGQIASFADAHYLVEKKSTKNSTLTSIRHLSDDEHHNEIARIISGENVTPESLGAAKALKQEARELVG